MKTQTSVTGKEPWLAVILSGFFPGIGQIYAGRESRGLILIFVALSLISIGGWFILSATGDTLLGCTMLIACFVFSIFNLFDAHRCVRRGNNSEFEILRKGDKDPWLAVFLSGIITGLGHAYQGQWLFAFLFFIIISVTNLLGKAFPLAALVGICLYFFCFYHVYISSPTRRAKSQRLILKICLFKLILIPSFAFTLRTFIVEARYIPSGAMLPTLQINDRLIVDKISYKFQEAQRGDIVVFSPTEVLSKRDKNAFIKRIIGLPGDTVEVKNNKVFVNNQPIKEEYIAEPPHYNWGPETVPNNQYFVLGDNRNNSYDSHFWGFVPRHNIIGKATKIFWPPKRIRVIH